MGMNSMRARRSFLRTGLAIAPGALAASLMRAQNAENQPDRMPNGRSQTEAILKADYEQNVKDARELTALARSIELDFDKNDQHVLSLNLLHKLDDADRLTKRIRDRIRR